jgi:hypothetical protein
MNDELSMDLGGSRAARSSKALISKGRTVECPKSAIEMVAVKGTTPFARAMACLAFFKGITPNASGNTRPHQGQPP